MDHVRARLRIEVVLTIISAMLFALTAVFPQWIEELTGLEPDAGSGALEWLIAGAFFVAAVISAVLARRDYRLLTSHRS